MAGHIWAQALLQAAAWGALVQHPVQHSGADAGRAGSQFCQHGCRPQVVGLQSNSMPGTSLWCSLQGCIVLRVQ